MSKSSKICSLKRRYAVPKECIVFDVEGHRIGRIFRNAGRNPGSSINFWSDDQNIVPMLRGVVVTREETPNMMFITVRGVTRVGRKKEQTADSS